MKIYKLYNQVDGFASIDFANEEIDDVLNGISDVSVLNGGSYKWSVSEDDDEKGDSPFYLGSFPIFEENKVRGIVFPNSKTAVFKVDDKSFIAVEAPLLSGSIIDKNFSDLHLFSNGEILSVWKFALNSRVLYPPIFRIEEFPLYTFVTEEMQVALRNLRLSQLLFEECDLVD